MTESIKIPGIMEFMVGKLTSLQNPGYDLIAYTSDISDEELSEFGSFARKEGQPQTSGSARLQPGIKALRKWNYIVVSRFQIDVIATRQTLQYHVLLVSKNLLTERLDNCIPWLFHANPSQEPYLPKPYMYAEKRQLDPRELIYDFDLLQRGEEIVQRVLETVDHTLFLTLLHLLMQSKHKQRVTIRNYPIEHAKDICLAIALCYPFDKRLKLSFFTNYQYGINDESCRICFTSDGTMAPKSFPVDWQGDDINADLIPNPYIDRLYNEAMDDTHKLDIPLMLAIANERENEQMDDSDIDETPHPDLPVSHNSHLTSSDTSLTNSRDEEEEEDLLDTDISTHDVDIDATPSHTEQTESTGDHSGNNHIELTKTEQSSDDEALPHTDDNLTSPNTDLETKRYSRREKVDTSAEITKKKTEIFELIQHDTEKYPNLLGVYQQKIHEFVFSDLLSECHLFTTEHPQILIFAGDTRQPFERLFEWAVGKFQVQSRNKKQISSLGEIQKSPHYPDDYQKLRQLCVEYNIGMNPEPDWFSGIQPITTKDNT